MVAYYVFKGVIDPRRGDEIRFPFHVDGDVDKENLFACLKIQKIAIKKYPCISNGSLWFYFRESYILINDKKICKFSRNGPCPSYGMPEGDAVVLTVRS